MAERGSPWRRLRPAVLAASLAAASACDVGDSSNGEAGGGATMAVAAPPFANRSNAAEPLVLSVRADGRELESVSSDASSGSARTVQITVPRGGSVTLDVEWSLPAPERTLVLATARRTLSPPLSDASLRFAPGDYDLSHDADGDGLSNLAELDGDSNPFDRDDPGGSSGPGGNSPVVNVRVPPIPPTELPGINGVRGLLWDPAAARDTNGRALAVDRLLIDEVGAEGLPPPDYRWYAMHDFESLYLFVEFEGTDMHTPFRDSASYFDDDALNLFFDGDGSRSSELGDGDFHIALPLVADAGGDRPLALAPDARVPDLPPSLAYGVCVCLDRNRPSGFEIRVALSDIGVEVGQPFGFEVQLDQDLDGGAREARWGWSVPQDGERGGAPIDSPRLYGTVLLVGEDDADGGSPRR